MTTTMIKIMGMALLVSTTAIAQDAKKDDGPTKSKYTSIGPVLGMGHSWVSNNVNNFKPSAHLGIGLLYSRYEHWGFGGILTASHEGYADEYYQYGNTYRQAFDPTYLRFTPRAYYFFGDYKDNVRPKIFLGPSVAYRLVEDQYMNEPARTGDGVIMYNTGNRFEDWDFGVNAGAGVNIKVGKYTWLNLDADYYHGLLNVTNNNTSMNRSLRANVGLMIGI